MVCVFANFLKISGKTVGNVNLNQLLKYFLINTLKLKDSETNFLEFLWE